jgi:hypothetical protein
MESFMRYIHTIALYIPHHYNESTILMKYLLSKAKPRTALNYD